MYEYIKNYPKDRENGWSEELQGVCHDDNNWFFTQDGNIWKFPVTHQLGLEVKSPNTAKGIYRNRVGLHLGDIDCYKGYIFVPVYNSKTRITPYIAMYSAKDLQFITKCHIKRSGAHFYSLAWCAIDPRTGLLYTSDKHCSNGYNDNTSPITVYSIDWDVLNALKYVCDCGDSCTKFLNYYATVVLQDEKGNPLTLEHTQGGCFDNEGHLHFCNGYDKSYANSKGGISVFTIPASLRQNTTVSVRRIEKSGQTGSDAFRYQFTGTGDEPQGLTYWDLNKDKRAPEINGVLHAIMLNNDATNPDDFYFKHYNRK